MDITHQVTPYQIEEASRFSQPFRLTIRRHRFSRPSSILAWHFRKAVIVKTQKSQYLSARQRLITPVSIATASICHEITTPPGCSRPPSLPLFTAATFFLPPPPHLAAGWDYTIAGPSFATRSPQP